MVADVTCNNDSIKITKKRAQRQQINSRIFLICKVLFKEPIRDRSVKTDRCLSCNYSFGRPDQCASPLHSGLSPGITPGGIKQGQGANSQLDDTWFRPLPLKFQRQIPFQFSPQGRNQGTGRPGTGHRMTLKQRKELFWGSPDSSWIELPASLTDPEWVPQISQSPLDSSAQFTTEGPAKGWIKRLDCNFWLPSDLQPMITDSRSPP